MEMLPANRPQMKQDEVISRRKAVTAVMVYPVEIVAFRGYFKKTMGDPNTNDLGVYDDASFIITPNSFHSFNFNTDPSRQLPGVAKLKANATYLYKVGLHGMHHLDLNSGNDKKILQQLLDTKKDVDGNGRLLPYWALRQYSNVTVLRGDKEYTDSPEDRFFIDIHRGGNGTTSSLGCQTVPPEQWNEFFWQDVKAAMEEHQQSIVPYTLIE